MKKNAGGRSNMELKKPSLQWKNHIIAAGLLIAFGFYMNRGIEIKGLYMDDLYLWSCYGEQSFWEYVFPMGGTRFRFLFYLVSYLILGITGTHIAWLVPINIILNSLIAITIYLMGRKLSKSGIIGFLSGIMYLMSRMSYYQIGQVYGLMESLALWAAIGILYCLYEYRNEERNANTYYIGANILYFSVCFIHERYMVLLPAMFLVLLLKHRKQLKLWLMTAGNFILILLIRMITIGTLSPAGTGGTDVADTFQLGEALRYAFSQVAYVFGINAGPQYLNGLSFADSPRKIQLLVLAADLMLAVLVVCFLAELIRNKKKRGKYLGDLALFLLFIALCIGSSSVTVRVELRWVYVSLACALLFLCYLFGVLTANTGGEFSKRKALPYGILFLLYIMLMFPTETFYRSQFPNIYLWPNQLRYNSLAEETYERYGEEIFGKTIYIIGNSYEMSEFTADTFFKVYDENRKAEGTKVEFIESIRDIAQVTEDMLVLREDPGHNAFQDITSYVADLKCFAVRGYYQDGWMEEQAQIRVMAGANGKIHLNCYYPGELEGDEAITVKIDGQPPMIWELNSNEVSYDLTVEPYQTAELYFNNNFYVKHAQEQRGDARLSMIVKITTD